MSAFMLRSSVLYKPLCSHYDHNGITCMTILIRIGGPTPKQIGCTEIFANWVRYRLSSFAKGFALVDIFDGHYSSTLKKAVS
jgi:hypothetical protein